MDHERKDPAMKDWSQYRGTFIKNHLKTKEQTLTTAGDKQDKQSKIIQNTWDKYLRCYSLYMRIQIYIGLFKNLNICILTPQNV